MSLGSKIRAIRKERKWTTTHLGQVAGCTQSTVSEIETDKRSPQVDTLDKIAKALNLSLVELLPLEFHPLNGHSLTDEEKELLVLLHRLNEDQRRSLITLINAFISDTD
ncbi:helix-turn-helix domain-containing protein [Paenibacillus agilis]|uniref:Helix-turn-helix transcriptional regulator n=1 Tax=Paenibacillus agilis TaxID=3020863 RepID=A0A559IDU0_9BACL|nr:helix-turn-helix transcriptional regulator [Paenibacillus agilis]TVX85623.1 helix-turn-helix transcriptional regulator [Paenibacillus agilis]